MKGGDIKRKKMRVDKDFDYSIPIAGKKIVEKEETEEPKNPSIQSGKSLSAARVLVEINPVETEPVQSEPFDWTLWKNRLVWILPGPPVFYIMFIIAMILLWFRIPH